MGKIKLPVVLLFVSSIAFAQSDKAKLTDVLPYNTSKDRPEYEQYHFPELNYPEKKVAEKINTFLQVEYLEHVPGVFKKHPFEKVCYNPITENPNTSFDGWEKLGTPKNILSLKIEGEYNGAYPEHFDNWRNFDLRTGNPILLKDLFVKSKTKDLENILTKRVLKKIKDYLLEIKDSLANPKLVGEERERFAEQEEMYNSCLENGKVVSFEYVEYYFTKDSMVFVEGRCSNHAMHALDDLDAFYLPIAYKDLGDYFSAYGKSLFEGKTTTAIPSNIPDGKIYKGTVGNIPVTLIIYQQIGDDGSFTCHYWYDKHKIPIECSGTFLDGKFELTEHELLVDGSEMNSADINAAWIDNRKIIGTWRSEKTGKVLKILLEPY